MSLPPNEGESYHMPDFIHEHSAVIDGEDGRRYHARVYADRRRDGTWSAWLEFAPADGTATTGLRTGQETSQPDRRAVDYWAGGLEPVYLEGALRRALERVSAAR
jgi:hypothetical protein